MNTITLIIADDHQVYLDGLQALLSNVPNITVVAEALNGDELIKKVNQHNPDVILIDISMPVKDGIQATQEIMIAYPATGIIALSAANDESSVADMLEAGASGYILKNSSKTEIVDAINIVSQGGYYYCKQTTAKLGKIIAQRKFNPYINKKQPLLNDIELKIIELICLEKTNKEIAEEVFLSYRTIEAWKNKIQEKLNVRNAAGIVIYAIKAGIFQLNEKR